MSTEKDSVFKKDNVLKTPFVFFSLQSNVLIVCLEDPGKEIEVSSTIEAVLGKQYRLVFVIGLQIDIWRIIKKAFEPGKDLVLTQKKDLIPASTDLTLKDNLPQEFQIPEDINQKDTDFDQEMINKAIEERREDTQAVKKKGPTEEADSPLIKLVQKQIVTAISIGASDIHFQPAENQDATKVLKVRFRVDGKLQRILIIPDKIQNAVISRLKILAGMNIAERQIAQDGRFFVNHKGVNHKGRKIDFRVSAVPTVLGEQVVLRILDPLALKLDLKELGLLGDQLAILEKSIRMPYGMILVTGPTGSGKTTTLYSCLANLRNESDHIMTIEDPVEYRLAGITQQQINEAKSQTFVEILRADLRQDPDILMVGEIRDFETAETAIKAALTGHLLLSTLHANDAAATISRLLNLGIEPFLVASALVLVIAQRLVRKICPECREEVKIPVESLIDLGFDKTEVDKVRIYHGRGCNNCFNTGYRGRIAIYECLEVTPEIRQEILKGGDITIREVAEGSGMISLRRAGLEAVKRGETTIEEVVKTTVRF